MKWNRSNILIIMLCFICLSGCSDNLLSSEKFTLTIVNGFSSSVVRHIYAAPTDTDEWGIDRLGAEVLNPGQSGSLQLSEDTYDVKAVTENGGEYFLWELKLNKDYTWTVR